VAFGLLEDALNSLQDTDSSRLEAYKCEVYERLEPWQETSGGRPHCSSNTGRFFFFEEKPVSDGL
jgi:hypothetical protein